MAKPLPDTALTRVIKPIVEGQIMSFLHDHPGVARSWRGKLANGKTQAQAIRDSLAKRITRDLLCEISVARLRAAILEGITGAPPGDGVEPADASSAAGMESMNVPAANPKDKDV